MNYPAFSDSPAWGVRCVLAFVEESLDAHAVAHKQVDGFTPEAFTGMRLLLMSCREALEPLEHLVIIEETDE